MPMTVADAVNFDLDAARRELDESYTSMSPAEAEVLLHRAQVHLQFVGIQIALATNALAGFDILAMEVSDAPAPVLVTDPSGLPDAPAA